MTESNRTIRLVQRPKARSYSVVDQVQSDMRVVSMQKYEVLRRCLRRIEFTHKDLAEHLGYGVMKISNLMTGQASNGWSLPDVYKVMDLLGEPYERIPEVFPPDGLSPRQRRYREG